MTTGPSEPDPGARPSRRLRLRPGRRNAWVWFLAMWALLLCGYFLSASGPAAALVYDVLGLSAAAAIGAGVRLFQPTRRRAWLLLALGLVLFSAGDVLWDAYELAVGADAPFPSAADALYLFGYLPLTLGLVLLWSGARTRDRLTDALVAASAFSVPLWVLAIDPLAGDSSLGGLEKAVAVAYPAADLAVAAAVAGLLLGSGSCSPSFRLLGSSAVLLLALDAVYYAGGQEYDDGSWVFAGYLLYYALLGAAALHPSMRNLGSSRTGQRGARTAPTLLLLGVILIAIPGTLIWERLRGEAIDIDQLVLGAALVPVALLRTAVLIHDVEQAKRRQARAEAARGRAEEERALLAERHEQLLEVDRLKDEFFALVSHEVRTPLTSILGYTRVLAEAPEMSAEQRHAFLATVERNAQRLADVVENLLFISGVESGRLELTAAEVDLAALAERCVESLRSRAEAAGLTLRLAAKPTILWADAERLTQLLEHLLSNALKFTPAGRVEVRVTPTGDSALLEVADTGIGIRSGEQERVFERFARGSNAVERQIQGTGLGLTIASAIVHAHHGTITLQSYPGTGTTVRVQLPGPVASSAGVHAA